MQLHIRPFRYTLLYFCALFYYFTLMPGYFKKKVLARTQWVDHTICPRLELQVCLRRQVELDRLTWDIGGNLNVASKLIGAKICC